MRAALVLPTPRAPVNRKAWWTRFCAMALVSVRATCSCPTSSSKRWGRYLRARTRYDIRGIYFEPPRGRPRLDRRAAAACRGLSPGSAVLTMARGKVPMRLDKLTIKAQEALQAAHDLAEQPRPPGDDAGAPARWRCSTRNRASTGAILRKLGHRPGRVWPPGSSAALDEQPAGARLARRRLRRQPAQGRCSKTPTKQSKEFKDEYVSSEHLLLALVDKDHGAASRALQEAGVSKDALLQGAGRGARHPARHRPGGRGQVPGAGQVHARPHRAGAQRASWIRSSAATRRSAARCRCCRAAPRTTRC